MPKGLLVLPPSIFQSGEGIYPSSFAHDMVIFIYFLQNSHLIHTTGWVARCRPDAMIENFTKVDLNWHGIFNGVLKRKPYTNKSFFLKFNAKRVISFATLNFSKWGGDLSQLLRTWYGISEIRTADSYDLHRIFSTKFSLTYFNYSDVVGRIKVKNINKYDA
jgi:hypothetical protein